MQIDAEPEAVLGRSKKMRKEGRYHDIQEPVLLRGQIKTPPFSMKSSLFLLIIILPVHQVRMNGTVDKAREPINASLFIGVEMEKCRNTERVSKVAFQVG